MIASCLSSLDINGRASDLLRFESKLVDTGNEMMNSKKIKSIVICLIAVVVGIIALLLIFGDFGWGAPVPHIWAKIVPAIYVIIVIALATYKVIKSLNTSWPPASALFLQQEP
jgi:hypothetical protein